MSVHDAIAPAVDTLALIFSTLVDVHHTSVTSSIRLKRPTSERPTYRDFAIKEPTSALRETRSCLITFTTQCHLHRSILNSCFSDSLPLILARQGRALLVPDSILYTLAGLLHLHYLTYPYPSLSSLWLPLSLQQGLVASPIHRPRSSPDQIILAQTTTRYNTDQPTNATGTYNTWSGLERGWIALILLPPPTPSTPSRSPRLASPRLSSQPALSPSLSFAFAFVFSILAYASLCLKPRKDWILHETEPAPNALTPYRSDALDATNHRPICLILHWRARCCPRLPRSLPRIVPFSPSSPIGFRSSRSPSRFFEPGVPPQHDPGSPLSAPRRRILDLDLDLEFDRG
ncbi:hypothetical protein NXS19_009216 [Fusarium pseudograminearum]|nr:hypothetical protein NXS19_009216 [Fusarium pseudograminearum]